MNVLQRKIPADATKEEAAFIVRWNAEAYRTAKRYAEWRVAAYEAGEVVGAY